MLKTAGVVALILIAGVSYAAKPKATTNVFDTANRSTTEEEIDKIVLRKLATMDIHPPVCSDGVFVRRVYLDVIGTLPTSKEAREFIESKDRNKRQKLIDRLLEREEYADYWSMKWGDILRIKAEFPVNLWPNAAQAYHRWVRASLASNKPYDKFVREMLTSSGSNFRVGPVNFYRAVQNRTPEGVAAAVALTLMGAQSEKWPKERQEGLANVFSQVGYKPTAEWKEEVVFWDPYHLNKLPGNAIAGKAALTPPPPTSGATPAAPAPAAAPPALQAPAPLKALFPDGKEITIPLGRDPRDIFADWLIRPENPWFAKCLVNRVWAWLLGRGIIHEPDDIRDDNPPVHPALLTYLEEEFVKSHYDLKAIYRLILNSRTYQASSVQRVKNPNAEIYFGCYIVRRLDAEVLIDAIDKVTGTTDLYTSAIPEPFTYIPTDKPAISIADGSIMSPFLALFGRSARATGVMNERPTKPLAAQWRHLLNSSHIQTKLESGTWMATLTAGNRTLEEIFNELYLTILSRYPTADEKMALMEYLFLNTSGKGQASGKGSSSSAKPAARGALPQLSAEQRRDNAIDIAWALINSTEFLFRH